MSDLIDLALSNGNVYVWNAEGLFSSLETNQFCISHFIDNLFANTLKFFLYFSNKHFKLKLK